MITSAYAASGLRISWNICCSSLMPMARRVVSRSLIPALVVLLAAPSEARDHTGAGPSPLQTWGAVSLRGKQYEVKRWVVRTSPNRFRGDYLELKLHGGSGAWIFRDDLHSGVSRSKNELAYHDTSRDLGLRAVPRLVAGSWNGRRGTLQRVVPDAQRSSGNLSADASSVGAMMRGATPDIDWDSLHAVAIQHYVTGMRDDAPYNILISKSTDGRLRYNAIDGERAFGRSQGFGQYHCARRVVNEGFNLGSPRQLSPTLWERLRKTDIPRWQRNMESHGISRTEIDQAVQRLRNVQERGLEAVH